LSRSFQEQDGVTSFKDIDDLPTISDQLLNYAQTYAQEDDADRKFSETDEEIHVEDSLVLTRFAIAFDEADEITLPSEAYQFQTILNVMENQELVLKDEPNRLSFVKKLSKMADFLGIRGRFHRSEDEMDCTLIRRSSRDGRSAGGHQSIDYTTALVDETMTVNKNFGKDAIFRGAIDARRLSSTWSSRSRRSRVRYYTYRAFRRSRLSRRIRDGMW
jgi:hypothetical protein